MLASSDATVYSTVSLNELLARDTRQEAQEEAPPADVAPSGLTRILRLTPEGRTPSAAAVQRQAAQFGMDPNPRAPVSVDVRGAVVTATMPSAPRQVGAADARLHGLINGRTCAALVRELAPCPLLPAHAPAGLSVALSYARKYGRSPQHNRDYAPVSAAIIGKVLYESWPILALPNRANFLTGEPTIEVNPKARAGLPYMLAGGSIKAVKKGDPGVIAAMFSDAMMLLGEGTETFFTIIQKPRHRIHTLCLSVAKFFYYPKEDKVEIEGSEYCAYGRAVFISPGALALILSALTQRLQALLRHNIIVVGVSFACGGYERLVLMMMDEVSGRTGQSLRVYGDDWVALVKLDTGDIAALTGDASGFDASVAASWAPAIIDAFDQADIEAEFDTTGWDVIQYWVHYALNAPFLAGDGANPWCPKGGIRSGVPGTSLLGSIVNAAVALQCLRVVDRSSLEAARSSFRAEMEKHFVMKEFHAVVLEPLASDTFKFPEFLGYTGEWRNVSGRRVLLPFANARKLGLAAVLPRTMRSKTTLNADSGPALLRLTGLYLACGGHVTDRSGAGAQLAQSLLRMFAIIRQTYHGPMVQLDRPDDMEGLFYMGGSTVLDPQSALRDMFPGGPPPDFQPTREWVLNVLLGPGVAAELPTGPSAPPEEELVEVLVRKAMPARMPGTTGVGQRGTADGVAKLGPGLVSSAVAAAVDHDPLVRVVRTLGVRQNKTDPVDSIRRGDRVTEEQSRDPAPRGAGAVRDRDRGAVRSDAALAEQYEGADEDAERDLIEQLADEAGMEYDRIAAEVDRLQAELALAQEKREASRSARRSKKEE